MLIEARKRDVAANAVLGLAFAANASQSPKELVKSGNVEGPGVQLMSRMMRKRSEAERNLDNPRVVSRGSKTFKEFVEQASITQRLKIKTSEMLKKHQDNPEKLKVYRNLLKKIRERQKPSSIDYPGRTSARRDKNLIPSHRTSSFPELSGISTITKNPKKIRKQRALGEIDK